MAPVDAKECGVCNEEYNTVDIVPRCLPCCHTFCSVCIQKLIAKNDKNCPLCRQKFRANFARSLGVNTSLSEALELVRELEGEREKQNEIISILTGLFFEGVKEVGDLDKTQKTLEVEKQNMSRMVKQIKKEEINLAYRDTSRQVAFPFDKTEEINSHIQKCLRDSKALMAEFEKIMRMIEEVSKTTEDRVLAFQEMLKSPLTRKPTKANLVPKFQLKSSQETLPQHITSDLIWREREAVKVLIKQGRVYGIQHLNGKQRCAKITIDKKNRLCLHHLKEEALPSNGHFIEHRHVMDLIDSTPKLAFMELSDVNKLKLGRVYIRLTPNIKYAEQFAMLCTGVAGPTYTNSRILGIHNKGFQMESVHFGHKIGKELIPEVWKEERRVDESPLLAGTLQGYLGPYASPEEAVQFYIYTRGDPDKTMKFTFGIVEEGLDLLSELTWSQPDIKGVVISESGLVLSI